MLCSLIELFHSIYFLSNHYGILSILRRNLRTKIRWIQKSPSSFPSRPVTFIARTIVEFSVSEASLRDIRASIGHPGFSSEMHIRGKPYRFEVGLYQVTYRDM